MSALLPNLLLAQQPQPDQSMPGMNMGTPQAKRTEPSAPPCVENMPGMQMCPKPSSPAGDPRTIGQIPGMKMDSGMAEQMQQMQQMQPKTFLQEIQHHATSGTSAEPNSTPTPMVMTMRGP